VHARNLLFETIAQRLHDVLSPGLTIIAVDGVDGAGKTIFADDLAGHLSERGLAVFRSGADHFHHSRSVRYTRGKTSPEGFYRDSYDYAGLREALLYPARIGRPARLALFDHRTDQPVAGEAVVLPLPAVLVFDGLFLHRPELRDEWDLSIFLDVPFEVSYARMAARDGSNPSPTAAANRRYYQGQQLYLSEANPRAAADILVDYADFDHPKILRPRKKGRRSAPELRG
jgi:uridine kinase